MMTRSKGEKVWERLTDIQKELILKHQTHIPVKVGAIAKELGLVVKKGTLKPGISGEIRRQDGGYIIRINRHDVSGRQRFTLAHEISHYLLHEDLIGDGLEDDMLYRSKLSNSLEVEANSLAAIILMPLSLVESLSQKYRSLPKDLRLEKMADDLGVSTQALGFRI
jgi:Zn-dependent peptidase ImmA (M78 family)